MTRARRVMEWAATVLLEVVLGLAAIGAALWYLGWLTRP